MGEELMDILNGTDVHQSNECDEPFLAIFWLDFEESESDIIKFVKIILLEWNLAQCVINEFINILGDDDLGIYSINISILVNNAYCNL